MKSHSNNPAVERAQPWLGTLVSIRVAGLDAPNTHHAIDAAFEEIALVHRLMSFHDGTSDVSRLNCSSVRRPVEVHPYTMEVVRRALAFSAASNGCFDVSVGAELVDWQFLPAPSGDAHASGGSWRDIEILPENRIAFHRPLWIDLGGIAKGFAVDRATERLRILGASQTVLNAGGDIRVQGQIAEPVRLAVESASETMPVLELTDGSVASSSGHRQRHWHNGHLYGPHVDGIRRMPAPTDRFVCVVAKDCVVADALTKIVMAKGIESVNLLQQFDASAYLHDPATGWQHLEGAVRAG